MKKKNLSKPSDKLFERAFRGNIPLSVVFELTRDCNLACRHCYIPASDRKMPCLSTREVGRILRDAASAGALYLVFTGGEIFLRPDIFDIINIAKELRFDVRLFTNATLLDGKKIDRIAAAGVSAVETSVYGRAAVHDRMTGKKGSWLSTVAAVELLAARGVRVVVKTPLMKSNFGERFWLADFARKRGITFRFDAVLAPPDDGGKKNLSLRLGPPEMEQIYRKFGPALPSEAEMSRPQMAAAGRREPLIPCSAGRNFASISCGGTLYPCLQLRIPLGDLRRESFSRLWGEPPRAAGGDKRVGKNFPTLSYLRAALLTGNSACAACSHLGYCQRCPGLALLEEGDILLPPSASCAASAARLRASRGAPR